MITGPIRQDGPIDHIVKKSGTPTMGGVIILVGIISSTLLWADLKNDTIPRFKLGIDKISNTSWRTSYSVSDRKDERRGDDLSFDIGLQLIDY